MKTVRKYKLSFIDREEAVLMPRGAEILFFGNQNGVPCLWARVETDTAYLGRVFVVCGTGRPDADGKYIGSALFEGGALVLHCFEIEI